MGLAEWILAGVVALGFGFVILRPDQWGRRDRGRADNEGGFYAADRRDRRDDTDIDVDGGDGDGGGGD